MEKCSWERLGKFRLIASVLLEANDDMRVGKTEGIQIDRLRFCWRRMMTCAWERLGKFRLIASFFRGERMMTSIWGRPLDFRLIASFFWGEQMGTCAWERLRKFRLIASASRETGDDMRLGKIDIQVDRFNDIVLGNDIRLGKAEEIQRLIASVVVGDE